MKQLLGRSLPALLKKTRNTPVSRRQCEATSYVFHSTTGKRPQPFHLSSLLQYIRKKITTKKCTPKTLRAAFVCTPLTKSRSCRVTGCKFQNPYKFLYYPQQLKHKEWYYLKNKPGHYATNCNYLNMFQLLYMYVCMHIFMEGYILLPGISSPSRSVVKRSFFDF